MAISEDQVALAFVASGEAVGERMRLAIEKRLVFVDTSLQFAGEAAFEEDDGLGGVEDGGGFGGFAGADQLGVHGDGELRIEQLGGIGGDGGEGC